MRDGIQANPWGGARAAFTMVELLLVIAIMAVLMTMLFPALSKSREYAYSIACASNLKQTALKAAAYSSDFPSGFLLMDSTSAPWAQLVMLSQDGAYSKKKLKPYLCPVYPPAAALDSGTYYNTFGLCLQGFDNANWFHSSSAPYAVFPNQSPAPSQQLFFGDSVGHSASSATTYKKQCYFLWWGKSGYEGVPMLRHANNANFVFVDGHAASLGLAPLRGWLSAAKAAAGSAEVWDCSETNIAAN